jgi:kynureninase
VHAELESRGILCDFRPDAGLRFGPHLFTTDEEIELAVTALVEIIDRGATLPAPAGTG